MKRVIILEKKETPIHILVRFSDQLLENTDTITEHNRVIKQHGAVWFGKMGNTVAHRHIECLNEQIEKGIPTFAYLVKGNRRKSTFFQCKLLTASRSLPEEEAHLVPSYYHEKEIIRYIRFWMKISEASPLDASELSNLKVASSVFPISETLYKSSSGHFIVKQI
jgi:hypothetical protein